MNPENELSGERFVVHILIPFSLKKNLYLPQTYENTNIPQLTVDVVITQKSLNMKLKTWS